MRRNGMRTKADVLLEREREMREALTSAQREIEGLQNTEFGRACSGCGEILETEWDFAKHFVIPDERYLNLGDCPKKAASH